MHWLALNQSSTYCLMHCKLWFNCDILLGLHCTIMWSTLTWNTQPVWLFSLKRVVPPTNFSYWKSCHADERKHALIGLRALYVSVFVGNHCLWTTVCLSRRYSAEADISTKMKEENPDLRVDHTGEQEVTLGRKIVKRNMDWNDPSLRRQTDLVLYIWVPELLQHSGLKSGKL